MSKKNNKVQEKQVPLYAKIVAGAVVATLVLVAVVGTVMIILESFHVGHVH